MNTSPPLSIVIVEILKHTPHWVWLILAAITLAGVWQLRESRVSRSRLLLAPTALGAYSLWGASSAFGAAAVPAWLAGMALALLANRALRWPRTVEVAADGRLVLRGSPFPLLLMWTLFGMRYAVAVTLVFHPAWAREGAMAVGVAGLYGMLSGLFTARAWRVLQSASSPVSVQAA
jgi:hypothetical protein